MIVNCVVGRKLVWITVYPAPGQVERVYRVDGVVVASVMFPTDNLENEDDLFEAVELSLIDAWEVCPMCLGDGEINAEECECVTSEKEDYAAEAKLDDRDAEAEGQEEVPVR